MEAKLIGSLLVESATSAFSRYDVRPNMLPAITVCAADSIRVNADIDNAVAMAMMTLLYFISWFFLFYRFVVLRFVSVILRIYR